MNSAKSELRQQMRAALGKISLAVRTVESMELCARLEPQLQSAHTILFYAPMPDELDVWPLLEKLLKTGKICALTAYDGPTQTYCAKRVTRLESDIVTGKFGVREPARHCENVALSRFDLVIVPGIAFDLTGNRLGRGLGFYDRILAETSGVKCGVAYDLQLQPSIPVEAHDAKVKYIFTPTRCVRGKL